MRDGFVVFPSGMRRFERDQPVGTGGKSLFPVSPPIGKRLGETVSGWRQGSIRVTCVRGHRLPPEIAESH